MHTDAHGESISAPAGRIRCCRRVYPWLLVALARSGVISENDVVQTFDVAADEIRAFVEIRVVEAVTNALEDERGLLDVDLAVRIDGAALAARHDPIQRHRISRARVGLVTCRNVGEPRRQGAQE